MDRKCCLVSVHVLSSESIGPDKSSKFPTTRKVRLAKLIWHPNFATSPDTYEVLEESIYSTPTPQIDVVLRVYENVT